MPERVICQQCKTVLYEGDELKPPEEIIQSLNGRCPKCDRKLSIIPTIVEVKATE
jgi:RNase P subunit RPR2